MTSNVAETSDPPTIDTLSILAPISASLLRIVDPAKVMRLFKDRERYELEIAPKQSEVLSLKVFPHTASVDNSLLNYLLFMGKFDSIAPDASPAKDLTDAHIKAL